MLCKHICINENRNAKQLTDSQYELQLTAKRNDQTTQHCPESAVVLCTIVRLYQPNELNCPTRNQGRL